MHCFPTSSAGATTTTSGSTCSSLRPLLTTWLSLARLSSEDALSRDLEEAAGVRNWGRLEATSRLAVIGEVQGESFGVMSRLARTEWQLCQHGFCSKRALKLPSLYKCTLKPTETKGCHGDIGPPGKVT